MPCCIPRQAAWRDEAVLYQFTGSDGRWGTSSPVTVLNRFRGGYDLTSIVNLLNQIKQDEIVLPAIQRDFVWPEAKVMRLLKLCIPGLSYRDSSYVGDVPRPSISAF